MGTTWVRGEEPHSFHLLTRREINLPSPSAIFQLLFPIRIRFTVVVGAEMQIEYEDPQSFAEPSVRLAVAEAEPSPEPEEEEEDDEEGEAAAEQTGV